MLQASPRLEVARQLSQVTRLESSPPGSHRRLRSPDEIMRFEPERSQVLVQTLAPQQQFPIRMSSLTTQSTSQFSPDLTSRSFAQVRALSPYM
jgi:hypothetical protein